eukprot:g46980.t1
MLSLLHPSLSKCSVHARTFGQLLLLRQQFTECGIVFLPLVVRTIANTGILSIGTPGLRAGMTRMIVSMTYDLLGGGVRSLIDFFLLPPGSHIISGVVVPCVMD